MSKQTNIVAAGYPTLFALELIISLSPPPPSPPSQTNTLGIEEKQTIEKLGQSLLVRDSVTTFTTISFRVGVLLPTSQYVRSEL